MVSYMATMHSPREKAAFLHQLIAEVENASERFNEVGYSRCAVDKESAYSSDPSLYKFAQGDDPFRDRCLRSPP